MEIESSKAETSERETEEPSKQEEATVQYTIARVDGNIDWESIPELSLDNIQWEPDQGV